MKYKYIMYGYMAKGSKLSCRLCKNDEMLRTWLKIINIGDDKLINAIIKEANQLGSIDLDQYNDHIPNGIMIKISLFEQIEENSTPIGAD